MKKIWQSLKPYLRWVILGGTLFFLGKALKENWREVATLRITSAGWVSLAIAFSLTLLAHVWSGWVWSWILQELRQPFAGAWGVWVYLTTNFAKYLPGNVWHLYGRIKAVSAAGGSSGAATLSVLLEPLFMSAAALLIAVGCTQLLGALDSYRSYQWLEFLGLPAILMILHPWSLNPVMRWLSRFSMKMPNSVPNDADSSHMERYPLRPLLGELGFMGLRGGGFLLTWLALKPIAPAHIPLVFSAFSIAWMLGLITPGAPGGIGVFEATAIALLEQEFSPGLILSVVALNRVLSILAEAGGFALAWLYKRLVSRTF